MACGFLYTNLASGLTAAGTSPVTGLGFDRFNDAQPRARVRFAASAANFQFDLSTDQSWDCAGLISTTLGSADSARLRAISSNSIPNSADLTLAAWTKNACTVTAGIADPFGGTSAFKLAETAANAQHDIMQDIPAALFIGSTNYIISCYAKAAERSFFAIGVIDKGSVSHFQTYNLSTGAVGTTTSGVSAAFITSIGSGWYRCGFTFGSGSGARTNVSPQFQASSTDSIGSYLGTAGNGINVDGPQIDYASTLQSYVPTGATAGVLYDSTALTGVTDSKWLGNVIGCLASPVSARYARWDLTGTNPIDVGLAPVGLLFRPGRNYDFGAQRGRRDLSQRIENPDTGSEFGIVSVTKRVYSMTFSMLSDADALTIDDIDRLVGTAQDVLFIPDTSDTWINRARDSIWGGFRPPGSAEILTSIGPITDVNSRVVKMVERL